MLFMDLSSELHDVIEKMKMANETDQPTRSRHLSLAITYAEDALNRLGNAHAESLGTI